MKLYTSYLYLYYTFSLGDWENGSSTNRIKEAKRNIGELETNNSKSHVWLDQEGGVLDIWNFRYIDSLKPYDIE